jgi:PKHD-type hydroxylase
MSNPEIKLNPDLCRLFLFKNAFSPEECDEILKNYAKPEGNTEINYDSNLVKLSGTYTIEDNAESKWIFDKLLSYVQKVNKLYNFKLSAVGNPFILEYKKDDVLNWHIDLVGKPDYSIRKITLIVFLTNPDEYKGGEIHFDFFGDKAVNAAKGNLLAFPAFLFHKVNKIEEGVRKSLVTWVLGPPFS